MEGRQRQKLVENLEDALVVAVVEEFLRTMLVELTPVDEMVQEPVEAPKFLKL